MAQVVMTGGGGISSTAEIVDALGYVPYSSLNPGILPYLLNGYATQAWVEAKKHSYTKG